MRKLIKCGFNKKFKWDSVGNQNEIKTSEHNHKCGLISINFRACVGYYNFSALEKFPFIFSLMCDVSYPYSLQWNVYT